MQYVKCLVILMDQLIPHECFPTKSLLFSRSLNDSSKAISQNGLILNLTPLVSIPVPVLLILGLMAKSITLFTELKSLI